MKWQHLSGNGKRVLCSALVCCLWICALPAAARAQAKISSPTCSVQTVMNGPMQQSSIKGTMQVTGLNPLNASTTLNFTFQTRPNANAAWANMNITGSQTTNGVNGTANFDTGWNPIGNGAPPQGAQYRVSVSGFYLDGNGNQVALNGIASTPITPNP